MTSDMQKDIAAIHSFVETYVRTLERERVAFTREHIGILEMHLVRENILSPVRNETYNSAANNVLDERFDIDYFNTLGKKNARKKLFAAMETLAMYTSQNRREVVYPLTNRYALAVYHLYRAGHVIDGKLGAISLNHLQAYLEHKELIPKQIL